jgi:hypothetical protein
VQSSAAFTLPIIRESLSQSYAPGYGQLKDVPSIPVKHNKLTDLAAAPMLRPLWRKSRYQSSVIVPTPSRKVVDRLRIAQASLARGARGAQQFLQSGLLEVRWPSAAGAGGLSQRSPLVAIRKHHSPRDFDLTPRFAENERAITPR